MTADYYAIEKMFIFSPTEKMLNNIWIWLWVSYQYILSTVISSHKDQTEGVARENV